MQTDIHQNDDAGGIRLRPHHALCAQFFVGKGYSEEFTEHMYAILAALDRGAVVTLTDGCDAICTACPHNAGGVCETDAKVNAIDRRALEALGLGFGETLSWSALSSLAEERIIAPGKLTEVCRDCEWIGLCESMRTERRGEAHDNPSLDPKIRQIFARFFDWEPVFAVQIDTSRGDSDFRNTFILSGRDGEKTVLKIVSNDFTFPEKIRMWQRTVEEYRDSGYYCPRIFGDKTDAFPIVEYHGKRCAVYAEEFSEYPTLEDRTAGTEERADTDAYAADIWRMTAKIAAKRLDYTAYPSGQCLFETHCLSDETDEVTENALEWKKTADALPEVFRAQTQRIWRLWNENREALKPLYETLPTSVFQADLNPTNLLIGPDGSFKGVMDFNLCGRDVFLNDLMRENYGDFEPELEKIRKALRYASEYYEFSAEEKAAALPLYRCLKPLWYIRVEDLKEAGTDEAKIRRCLDRTEYYLTADIDFTDCMG